jgi:two-component sensor histidine kinase
MKLLKSIDKFTLTFTLVICLVILWHCIIVFLNVPLDNYETLKKTFSILMYGNAAIIFLHIWRKELLYDHQYDAIESETWSLRKDDNSYLFLAGAFFCWLQPLSMFFIENPLLDYVKILESTLNNIFFLLLIPDLIFMEGEEPKLIRWLLGDKDLNDNKGNQRKIKFFKKVAYFNSIALIFNYIMIFFFPNSEHFYCDFFCSLLTLIILGIILTEVLNRRKLTFLAKLMIISFLLNIITQPTYLIWVQDLLSNIYNYGLYVDILRMFAKNLLISAFWGLAFSFPTMKRMELFEKIKVQNSLLTDLTDKLISQNNRLIALREEMSHRAKNIIQINISYLANRKRELETLTPQSEFELIDDMTRRLNTMVIVHNMLHEEVIKQRKFDLSYFDENRDYLDLNLYLIKLLDMIPVAFGFKENQFDKKLHLTNVPPIHIENVQDIGLIIFELVTNAFKHSEKEIHLKIRVYDEFEKLYIRITDDGPSFDTDDTKSQGYGTKLVQTIVEHKWEGKYIVTPEIDSGATVLLIIPIHQLKINKE